MLKNRELIVCDKCRKATWEIYETVIRDENSSDNVLIVEFKCMACGSVKAVRKKIPAEHQRGLYHT